MPSCRSPGCRAMALAGGLCGLHALAARRDSRARLPVSADAERLRQVMRRKAARLGLAIDEGAVSEAVPVRLVPARGRRLRSPIA